MMNTTKPPITPRTPLSPSFADYMQSVLPQEATLLSTKAEATPPATTAVHTAMQTTPQKPDIALMERHYNHLMRPLAPLLSIETGKPHSHFPPTLLHYHLLSQTDLDDLAHFYHQRTPTKISTDYPMPVIARWHALPDENDMKIEREILEVARSLGNDVEEIGAIRSKRRRFGRFFGLQGMRSAEASEDGVMREEMERYVAREMARKEEKAREREVWEAKGFF